MPLQMQQCTSKELLCKCCNLRKIIICKCSDSTCNMQMTILVAQVPSSWTWAWHGMFLCGRSAFLWHQAFLTWEEWSCRAKSWWCFTDPISMLQECTSKELLCNAATWEKSYAIRKWPFLWHKCLLHEHEHGMACSCVAQVPSSTLPDDTRCGHEAVQWGCRRRNCP